MEIGRKTRVEQFPTDTIDMNFEFSSLKTEIWMLLLTVTFKKYRKKNWDKVRVLT